MAVVSLLYADDPHVQGQSFNSQEFRKFADNMGFKHRKITPLWTRANAESERFMKTIGKAIRAARTEHRSWIVRSSVILLLPLL
jgi:hypothetical protein